MKFPAFLLAFGTFYTIQCEKVEHGVVLHEKMEKMENIIEHLGKENEALKQRVQYLEKRSHMYAQYDKHKPELDRPDTVTNRDTAGAISKSVI